MTAGTSLTSKVFASFDPGGNSLTGLMLKLLAQQKTSWDQLASGYSSLRSVETRNIPCDGFDVKLQWNPQRIVSTTAMVDEQSIRGRKCFLCLENLPYVQQGVLYREEFLILCNPAPIFPNHFTISHVNHVPQLFEPALGAFLDLAKEMSPQFSVFYNGPKCGASAPDHLHFQSGPRNAIPAEVDAVDARRREIVYKSHSVAMARLKNYGRAALVIESTDKEELSAFLRGIVARCKEILGISEEPMMNVICVFREMVWRVILFLRSKHRPGVYFKEGDDRVLISPAAVDMGGLVITPVQKDFHRVDARLAESILHEVSLEEKKVSEILKK